MTIREIEAKTLLLRCKDPVGWFGVHYNMNLYRGCEHHCIYCDSRSECYQIADFDGELLVKVNAIDLLRQELARKRVKGKIGTGAMQDPYTPAEAQLNMTGQALEVIADFRYPVHIITKSDLILKDLDTLVKINRVEATVCFTITTANDDLAAKVEPGAPSPSRRLAAARVLSDHGISVGVTMMPILPFIEDTEENIVEIVHRASASGVRYIVPGFGMTLRTRQREYFYSQLDACFPGLRVRYERRYGAQYGCSVPNARQLSAVFQQTCAQCGVATSAQYLRAGLAVQPSLL